MMQFLLCLVFGSCVLTVLADLCYQGACDPGQTCCETVFSGLYMCCPLKDAVCCYGQIHCCPKGFVCGPEIRSCQKKPMRAYLDDVNELKRQGLPAEDGYLHDINELKRQGLPAEERYLDDINELEKRQGLPAEEVYLDDINELEKRQGLSADERPFFQNRCDDRTFCPYDSTCCLSLDGTYGCCPYLYATCCPDKVHCCPHNEKCDATSRHCIGVDSTFPSKAKEPTIVIDEESLI